MGEWEGGRRERGWVRKGREGVGVWVDANQHDCEEPFDLVYRLLVQLLSSQASVLVDFPQFPGAVDYKICPHCPSLLACVHEGDLWILNETGRHQLTNTAGEGRRKWLGLQI